MTKGRVVAENGFGRVFVFGMGRGEVLLMVESGGDAQVVGVSMPEALRLGHSLLDAVRGAEDHGEDARPTAPAPGVLPAAPVRPPDGPARSGGGMLGHALPIGTGPSLADVARVYQSAAAGQSGNRRQYVADHFDISTSSASYRIARAREQGLITRYYRQSGGRR